jgi:hypothetical protein
MKGKMQMSADFSALLDEYERLRGERVRWSTEHDPLHMQWMAICEEAARKLVDCPRGRSQREVVEWFSSSHPAKFTETSHELSLRAIERARENAAMAADVREKMTALILDGLRAKPGVHVVTLVRAKAADYAASMMDHPQAHAMRAAWVWASLWAEHGREFGATTTVVESKDGSTALAYVDDLRVDKAILDYAPIVGDRWRERCLAWGADPRFHACSIRLAAAGTAGAMGYT